MRKLTAIGIHHFLTLIAVTLMLLFAPLEDQWTGWDLLGHGFLTERLADYIRKGAVSGYDTLWFGGYDEFLLYPQFGYLPAALLQILTGAPNISFNIWTGLLPVLFFSMFVSLSQALFGKEVIPYAILFSILWLLAPIEVAHCGIGAWSLLSVGYLPQFVGFLLMLIYLRIIGTEGATLSFATILLAASVLALLILTHSMTALFVLFLTILQTPITSLRRSARLLSIIFLGCLLSVWWLLPFYKNYFLNSAVARSSAPAIRDPILALFPFDQLMLSDRPLLLKSAEIFVVLFLLLGASLGSWQLSRSPGKRFLPFATIILFLALPRNLLTHLAPIHTYRYLGNISVLVYLIAGYGAYHLFEHNLCKLPRISHTLKITLALSLSISLILDRRSPVFAFSSEGYPGIKKVGYPYVIEAERFLSQLEKLNPSGRIAVEERREDRIRLGSPHFFTTEIPRRFGVSVLPGLLAESAPLSPYLYPALTSKNGGFLAGDTFNIDTSAFHAQSLESMIKRLAFLGAEFVLATSDGYISLLSEASPELLKLEMRSEHFALFRVQVFSGLTQSLKKWPFYFVPSSRLSFRKFSAELYRDPEIFDELVINDPNYSREVPEELRQSISGIVVADPDSREMMEMNWCKFDVPVFLLASGEQKIAYGCAQLGATSSTGEMSELKKFFLRGKPSHGKSGSAIELNFSTLIIEANEPALIRYGYSPYWRMKGAGKIYLASPAFMYVSPQ